MRIYATLLGLSFMVALAGCVEGPPSGATPDMTFANFEPLAIEAAQIKVVNNYKPPLQEPNVEHTFRPTPYTAVEKLIKKQLIPVGKENVLRVVIEDASVVREELLTSKGFLGTVMQEPSERLRAKMLLRFELVNPKAPDIVLGHAEVLARRDKTLAAGISPADRDRAYFGLTEDLMDEVNDGLRSIVKNTFGRKY